MNLHQLATRDFETGHDLANCNKGVVLVIIIIVWIVGLMAVVIEERMKEKRPRAIRKMSMLDDL